MQGEVYNQSICLVIKVAKMYYSDHMSQKKISEILNISPPTVSRLLKRARDEKIIRFDMPDEFKECIYLESCLKEKFDLNEIIVVPTCTLCETSPMEVKKAVALEGARYLERSIVQGDILGIAWGGTMYELIQYLNPCRKNNTSFITLHGSITSCNSKFEVNSLVNRIAMAYGGSKYATEVQGLLSSEEDVEKLKKTEEVARLFSIYNKISISVSGIGSFYPEQTSPLSQLSYLSEKDLNTLMEYKPYADIMLRFLDKDGNECCQKLSKRTLAIDLDVYRKIPKKIIVASGTHKGYSLKAVLKGKLVNVLIVDYNLASKLMAISD